jgi:hypothetical protein
MQVIAREYLAGSKSDEFHQLWILSLVCLLAIIAPVAKVVLVLVLACTLILNLIEILFKVFAFFVLLAACKGFHLD